jgi:hypothetical protein
LEELFGTFGLSLGSASNSDDTPSKECKNSSEDSKCYACEKMGSPGIAVSELVETVKDPGAVKNQDLENISNL